MRITGLTWMFVVAAAAGVGLGLARRPAGEVPAMKTSTHCVVVDGPAYSRAGYDITPLTRDRVEELARALTPEEATILLRKGTEPPFCGNLLDNKTEGLYACRLCGLPLYSSETKFHSGTGWPSFYKPVDAAHVREERDNSHGMVRVEILCARCGGHLGHVFDDAPQTPTGKRHCLNSASLRFYGKDEERPAESRPVTTETGYFAGGCFWGVEDRFQKVPGVIDVVSGYMGGRTANPTYEEVCTQDTGHAEVVRVVFDPARVTYAQLLKWFFKFHDPTQVNRQGPDVGEQYRSAIFAATPEQAEQARKFIDEAQKSTRYRGRRIATAVSGPESKAVFTEAEEYHQDYHAKHGGSCPMPDDDE